MEKIRLLVEAIHKSEKQADRYFDLYCKYTDKGDKIKADCFELAHNKEIAKLNGMEYALLILGYRYLGHGDYAKL